MSLSLSVSLLFLCLGEGGLLCHIFVIILLCIFYVLFISVSLKDVRAREKVRGDTSCFSYIPSQKKRRIKQEYLAMARLLLPTSNLLLTSGADKQD